MHARTLWIYNYSEHLLTLNRATKQNAQAISLLHHLMSRVDDEDKIRIHAVLDGVCLLQASICIKLILPLDEHILIPYRPLIQLSLPHRRLASELQPEVARHPRLTVERHTPLVQPDRTKTPTI